MNRGDILRVNLLSGMVSNEPISEKLMLDFVGGRGINGRILYDETERGLDPLSPEAPLIFGVGPLTGTPSPASGRWVITAKSPMTGIFGEAHAGGYWGAELRYAGHEHLIITGKANKPIYLLIEDERVEIRDANHLWGKNVWETQKLIREELGDSRVQIACIGPGGENLVKWACVINGLTKSAGRCGMGAVMGSKNLKAIAVRGHGGVKVAKPIEFMNAVQETKRIIREHPNYKNFSKYGTMLIANSLYDNGRLTFKNIQTTRQEGYNEKLRAENFIVHTVKHKACFGCPCGCGHRYVVKEGPFAGIAGDGTELTTFMNLVGVGIEDWGAMFKATELCNLYGLDTASAGVVLQGAFECYQRGLLTQKDTDGLALEWGNVDVVLELLRKTAYREGFGNILAESTVGAAKKIGKGADKYFFHIKGLDMLLVMHSAFIGSALCYATSTRGADHLRGLPTTEFYVFNEPLIRKRFGHLDFKALTSKYGFKDKAPITVWHQHFSVLFDSLPMCTFNGEWMLAQGIDVDNMAELLSSATGIDYSSRALMKAAERIYNVEHMFNVREGIRRKDDTVPWRYFEEPCPDGPDKGRLIDVEKWEKLKDEYYDERGWDRETGIPTKKKLAELGLEGLVKDLKNLQ